MADEPQGGAGQNPNEPNSNTEQQPATSWRDALPEAIRGEKTLTKFKDVEALAQSYVNLEKFAGGALRVPGEKATPEEVASFREKLGVPKTPAEYGVEVKVPEGMPWDKEAEQGFIKTAHGLGLTKSQVQGVLDYYVGSVQAGLDGAAQQRAATVDEALATMRQEWGGLASRNLALVQRVVAEFGDDDTKGWLERSGVGNDPQFLRFVARLAGPLVEDNLISGENLGVSRTDAQAEIKKLMGTKEYLKGDKQIIERIRELTPLAHGG